MKEHPTMRHRVWDLCEPDDHASALERGLHLGLMGLIVLNVIAVVLASVQSLAARFQPWFDCFEVLSVIVFSAEYLARLWSCTADPRYAHPLWGRLRYVFTPLALVDLVAVLPFYLVFLKVDLRLVRAFRLIRLARIAKLGHYAKPATVILRVLHEKRQEMVLTLGLLMTLALIGATLMYYIEGGVQPDKFPDIPSALWWAVITITTIGYGDVYPVTPLGKVIGACFAILGILMIALPTGVFGAAFVEELNKQRTSAAKKCPHCGKDLS